MQDRFPSIPPGMRVIPDMRVALVVDFKDFAVGESGRVFHVDTDSGLAWVSFDAGGSCIVPLLLLAETTAESLRAARQWLRRALKLGTNLGQSIPPKG
jgi:hypothetical protein